jgi:hypothetical protein
MAIVDTLESQLAEAELDFAQQREGMCRRHTDALARLAHKEQTVVGTMAARVKEKELLLERSLSIERYPTKPETGFSSYTHKIAKPIPGLKPAACIEVTSLHSFVWEADKITFGVVVHEKIASEYFELHSVHPTIVESLDRTKATEFFEQKQWRFAGVKLPKSPRPVRMLFDFSPLIDSIVSVPCGRPYGHEEMAKLINRGDKSIVGCLYPKLTFIDTMTCLVDNIVLIVIEGGFSKYDLLATMPDGRHAVYLKDRGTCVPI